MFSFKQTLLTSMLVPLMAQACGSFTADTTHQSGVLTAQPAASTRLVTIADNDAGWVLAQNTSQWISPECRDDVEARGGDFELVEWEEIAGTIDPKRELGCNEIGPAAGAAAPATPVPPVLNETLRPTTPEAGAPELKRGINFAGDFEVEPRRSWGAPVDPDWFRLVAANGFDHVRVPIRWSSYTSAAPRFEIDAGFFAEIDQLVALAAEADLAIVLDVHHFEELDADPLGERDRFLAIWRQIASRYAAQPNTVVFELLNEPIGLFSQQPELFNRLAADALAVIRQTNPTRTVIIGPVNYNHPSALETLRLPDDPNLMATIHVYDPTDFTTQGAVFIDPIPPTGVLWRPEHHQASFEWRMEPWDATVTPTSEGLSVSFDRAFAAFALVTVDGPQTVSNVEVRTNRSFEAVILCNYLNGSPTEADVEWRRVGSGFVGTGDVSACGSATSLALQPTVEVDGPVMLTGLTGCISGCAPIVVTEYEALDQVIGKAAGWAAAQGVPLYLGEFGTYDPIGTPTDRQSRFAWTRAMRDIAESHDIGWAYFAMDDEFGAFDRDADRWIPEVFDALMG